MFKRLFCLAMLILCSFAFVACNDDKPQVNEFGRTPEQQEAWEKEAWQKATNVEKLDFKYEGANPF